VGLVVLGRGVVALDDHRYISKVDEFRAYAVDCMRLAATISDPTRKLSMVQMAEAWNRLANHVELAKDYLSEDVAVAGGASGTGSGLD
jgi:hypothetical protein